MRHIKVYTAGDMKSGWQDTLKAALPDNVELIDPRSSGLSDPVEYTRWDLEGVRDSDVVVAYMGPHNPSGFGLCIEAGYALALGKPVIFVDALRGAWRSRYFDMLRVSAYAVVNTLEEAAALLARMSGH